MANIGYYGSHNAAIAIEQDGKIISVIEFERFVGYKNTGVAQYKVIKHKSYKDLSQLIKYALQFVKEEYGIEHFENCVYASSDVVIDNKIVRTHLEIPADNHFSYLHHRSHAAGTFYQSPYNEAIIFSFDVEDTTDVHLNYNNQEEGFTVLHITSGTTATPLGGTLWIRVGELGGWESKPWNFDVDFILKPTDVNYTGTKTEASKGLAYGNSTVNEGIYNPLSTIAQAGVNYLIHHQNQVV